MTDEDFDKIVAGFYRAAQGYCGWVKALEPFQEAMNAFAVHLHAVDLAQQRVIFSYNAAHTPPEAEVDYVRTYHRIDPRANLAVEAPVGVWFNCWERFDERFVAQSRFYQEFLIPYGGRYASGVKLVEQGSQVTMLGVHRGLGAPRLTEDELQTCQRLARHLTEALKLQQVRAANARQMLLGSHLLTRLRAPVVLIDEDRRLLHINPAASSLLAATDVLTLSADRLFCRRGMDDDALAAGLRELLRDALPSPRAGDGKLFIRARSLDSPSTLGLYFYAMRPAETLHAFGDQSLAMLIIHRLGIPLELDPFVVAAAFDLTPAEARVAVAAAQGRCPKEIASANGVTVKTIRTQLSAAFVKTGTTRQSELVSVLSSLPMAALRLD